MTRTFAESLAWAADGAAHLRGMMLRMGDDAFAARSALPDWTRAHVLTHVARNADALGNLIEWARTGRPKPAYASREQRNADIATGAKRAPGRSAPMSSPPPTGSPPAVRDTPAQAWSATVQSPKGEPIPAADILWWRAREVWIPTPSTSTPARPSPTCRGRCCTSCSPMPRGRSPPARTSPGCSSGRPTSNAPGPWARGRGRSRCAGPWRSWRRGCSAGRRAATCRTAEGPSGRPSCRTGSDAVVELPDFAAVRAEFALPVGFPPAVLAEALFCGLP